VGSELVAKAVLIDTSLENSQVYVSPWAGVAPVGAVAVVYVGFGDVEGLAVGWDGLPEVEFG
jgi:hypothetical protein